MLRAALALVMCLGMGAGPASGQYRPATPREQDETIARWGAETQEIHELLMAHRWKKAERRARRLSGEMVNKVIEGAGGRQYLGRVTYLRSVALAGLGEKQLANWYWRISVQLFPLLAKVDPDDYSPDVPLGIDRGDLTRPDPGAEAERLSRFAGKIVPPVKISGPKPVFPKAKLGRDIDIVVVFHVGVDGRVYDPEFRNLTDEYTLAYAALDAIATWEFEPSRVDGRAMESMQVYTVRYKTRR